MVQMPGNGNDITITGSGFQRNKPKGGEITTHSYFRNWAEWFFFKRKEEKHVEKNNRYAVIGVVDDSDVDV